MLFKNVQLHLHLIGGGQGGAGGGGACPPTFLQMFFFLHANAKVASRCRHAANIAFDLFNIILYVIARKVRKCPLSPVVTSNVVLSGLVRLADILARLVQMADSLSTLIQLTGALFTINWGTLCQTHLHPSLSPLPLPSAPPPPIFWTAPPPLHLKPSLNCS